MRHVSSKAVCLDHCLNFWLKVQTYLCLHWSYFVCDFYVTFKNSSSHPMNGASQPYLVFLHIILSSWYCPTSVQFSSVTQSCPTLCSPMNHSTPGLPVHQQLPESIQTHVHWISDAIQPYHPLSSPSPPALNLSHHQGLFKWVSSLHQVAKVLEFQLQH